MGRRAPVLVLLALAASIGLAPGEPPQPTLSGRYALDNWSGGAPAPASRGPALRAEIEVENGRITALRMLTGFGLGSRLDPVLSLDGGFSLDVVWTDWQAPGKANNADNLCHFTAADFRCIDVEERRAGRRQEVVLTLQGPEGLVVELTHAMAEGDFWLRRVLRVRDPKGRGHFLHSLQPLDSLVRRPAEILKAGGFGQPVALRDGGAGAFFGLEWPSADNSAEPAGSGVRVRCGQEIGEVVTPEGVESEPAVVAATPDARVRHWFAEYLDDVRVAPLRPYTLYNSWYDLRSAEYPKVTPDRVMNEENVLRIARRLRTNMVEKHGITLDAFVLDDGWDVYESDWVLRPAQFPNGLKPVVDELAKSRTRLGVWYGPTGGYSFRKKRVGWMREHGYETVGDQLWVGGPRYSALLERRTTAMARDGVRYFKWDGFQFLGTAPGLGTPPGIYARRAVLERVRAMARSVRAVDPDMFLNVTSGTWLSPWWLRLADQIWMGGEDYGESEVPSLTTRDASITYRDLVLHEDVRRNDFWFPVANLMTHGVLKGTIDVGEIGRGEPLSKFADEVVFYLARGVTMHELYISPDVLSEGEWRVLADALRWARDRFPVLKRTEMVGGDPNRLEPYGYAHWNGDRGILAVRNPGMEPRTLALTLDPEHGLDPAARDLVLERIYPTRWVAPAAYAAGDRLELPALLGYEAAVYEVYPLREAEGPLLADVVFEETGRDGPSRTLALLDAGPRATVLNPAALAGLSRGRTPLDPGALPRLTATCAGCFARGEVSAGSDDRSLAARVEVRRGARSATACVLLRPRETAAAMAEPVATLRVDGRKMIPQKVAVPGKWAWLTVPVAPGKRTLEVALAPGADGKPWAGRAAVWIVGAEAVEPVVLSVRGGPGGTSGRPLPSSGRGPFELPRSIRVGDVVLGEGRAR